jgi:hypothetical protein
MGPTWSPCEAWSSVLGTISQGPTPSPVRSSRAASRPVMAMTSDRTGPDASGPLPRDQVASVELLVLGRLRAGIVGAARPAPSAARAPRPKRRRPGRDGR